MYLAWTVGDDENADIRVAKSTDGGESFGAPRIVDKSKDYSDAPKLTTGLGARRPFSPRSDAGATGSSQGLLMRKLAGNRDGAFAIVNSSFQEGERGRVWLMRGRLPPY